MRNDLGYLLFSLFAIILLSLDLKNEPNRFSFWIKIVAISVSCFTIVHVFYNLNQRHKNLQISYGKMLDYVESAGKMLDYMESAKRLMDDFIVADEKYDSEYRTKIINERNKEFKFEQIEFIYNLLMTKEDRGLTYYSTVCDMLQKTILCGNEILTFHASSFSSKQLVMQEKLDSLLLNPHFKLSTGDYTEQWIRFASSLLDENIVEMQRFKSDDAYRNSFHSYIAKVTVINFLLKLELAMQRNKYKRNEELESSTGSIVDTIDALDMKYNTQKEQIAGKMKSALYLLSSIPEFYDGIELQENIALMQKDVENFLIQQSES